jgi:DNA repair exonuclease SbcCD ATPase subunit
MARHQSPLQPQRLSTSAPADCHEPYKSPRHKLLRFFEKSRDQWKAKCIDAKATVKRLQNRVRFLEKSKTRLQHRVSDLEGDLKTLKRLLQEKDHELAQLKKNCRPSISCPSRHRAVCSAPTRPHLFGGPRAVVGVVGARVNQ